MLATVLSCALVGIEAYSVQVEVDIAAGVPRTDTVGLPDHAVRESKERVRAALRNSGFDFPPRRVTVNLAPAYLRKQGAAYDLPIALAMLAANGHAIGKRLAGVVVAGELALDGGVRPIRGALSMAAAARAAGHSHIVVPTANVREASIVKGITVFPVSSLVETVNVLMGKVPPATPPAIAAVPAVTASAADLADVRGQEHAKRALEVAAAGGHNVLFIGPPGAGKTMLARRVTTILAPLVFSEALEVTKIQSAAGLTIDGALVGERPFRAPHHTVSPAGIFGGGTGLVPGELALAHHGILFLDELPEFRRDVLEGLGQPLEDRRIMVARAGWRATYPAHIMLIAAMNPCACGFRGDPTRICRCTPNQLTQYRARLSGPLLDRIDLHVEVAPVRYQELTAESGGERSATIRERVLAARERQRFRLRPRALACNAEMGSREIREHARPDLAGAVLLERAMTRLGLSARAYTRILKVARTIGDLAGAETVAADHVAEAIQYRSLDR